MEEYKMLLSSFTRLKRRYESMNCPDSKVDKLLDEIRETLSCLETLTGANHDKVMEVTTKIKILLAGARLILNDKRKMI